jgi:hypothetical protein
MIIKEWSDVVLIAAKRIRNDRLSVEYVQRLKYEIDQIEMQGANEYWMDLIREDKKFDHNKNGLVLPFLLNMTDIDPIIYKHIYELDDNGIVGDVVDVTLEDGSMVSLPAKAHVKIESLSKLVSDLKIGDEI